MSRKQRLEDGELQIERELDEMAAVDWVQSEDDEVIAGEERSWSARAGVDRALLYTRH